MRLESPESRYTDDFNEFISDILKFENSPLESDSDSDSTDDYFYLFLSFPFSLLLVQKKPKTPSVYLPAYLRTNKYILNAIH